jgi:pimeloyl-ACP methyl ester carboxylesterase
MRADSSGAQPVVILGGFLSFALLYCEMQDALSSITGGAVAIVPTHTLDWATVIVTPGWIPILRKLDESVRGAARESPTGKVTVVGHSAGGVLARLYLSPRRFWGRAYSGLDRVDHLITLGSPHYTRRRWLHGGLMSRWMQRRYPGAFFAPQVRYTSVAGKLTRGDPRGSLRERHAFGFYKDAVGQGDVWGDGLVPVSSSLLEGATPVVLEDVGHFLGFGGLWYGAPEVVPRWWSG